MAVIIPSFKRLFFVYLKYQMHISKDTTVDIGGANPIIYNEELSIWLNQYESGMRNRKEAIKLWIIVNIELPCPLK